MKNIFKTLLVFATIFLVHSSLIAQDVKPIMENEKQIVFKISNLDIDTEKIIKKEFMNDKAIKIVYICQETGMVVFESRNKISTEIKENIQLRLKKVKEAIEFLHMQGFTINEADKKCKTTKP